MQKMSKRLVGHCVLNRLDLKGLAALCGRSVIWTKCQTGKMPRLVLDPVYNTEFVLNSSALTCATRCKGEHKVINDPWSGSGGEKNYKQEQGF